MENKLVLKDHDKDGARAMRKWLNSRSSAEVSRELPGSGLFSRQTVRKFIQALSFPEHHKHSQTKSAIDQYRPYLHKRWQEGYQTTGQLWKEIQERGFTGSWMMVDRWVQLQQDEQSESADQSQPKTQMVTHKIAPRQLAWLFLHDPDRLEKQEQQTLTLLRQDPQIEMAYGFAQQFVAMMKEHNAQPLDAWFWACQMSGISDLVTFAASG